MADELLRDALKETRTAITALVTLSLLWLVTAQAAAGALIKRDHAKQVAAWLLLQDTFPDTLSGFLKEHDRREPIGCVPRIVAIQSGTEIEKCEPLIVRIPWPGQELRTLSLVPIENTASAYRVSSPRASLPLNSYAVAVVHEKVRILPIEYVDSERELHNAVLRDGLAAPADWPAVRTSLRSQGWQGDSPNALRLADRTVAAFIEAGFAASYSVGGVPVTPGYYPSAISGVFGLLAFVLIGPAIALRGQNTTPPVDSWTMLAQMAGWPGRALRWAQAAATIAVALLPLAVLVTQLSLASRLTPGERYLWFATFPGPIFAASVLGLTGAYLMRIRGWRNSSLQRTASGGR